MDAILHPLVLINISDHLTRECCRATTGQHALYDEPQNVVVLGALLGAVDGRQLTMVQSFEMALLAPLNGRQETSGIATSGVATLVDWEFFQQRLVQYHEVFPSVELVGWYISGAKDLVQTTFQFLGESTPHCDSPYILSVRNASDASVLNASEIMRGGCYIDSKTIPTRSTKGNPKTSIQLFERTSLAADPPSLKGIPYKIESGEAESICLSHIRSKAVRSSLGLQTTRTSQNAETTKSENLSASPLVCHLDSWTGAADELKDRIEAAIEFLRLQVDTDRSENADVLDTLATICHAIERERKSEEPKDVDLHSSFISQLVLSECSTVTAATAASLHQLAELKVTAAPRTGRGGGISSSVDYIA